MFFSIAFAYTWLVETWMILAHARVEFTILATCGPTISAIITHRLAAGNYRAFRFHASWARTFGASGLGVLLILTAFVIFPATATVDASKLNWAALASTSVYNYSTLFGGPLFEEPGWRGYALPRLEAHLSPAIASVVLGVLWAAWHLPLFLYPGSPTGDSPVWIYFLILIGYSVIMTFGANLARFGVITPILMHAIFNTNGRFFQGLFANAGPGSGGFLIPLLDRAPVPAGLSGHLPFTLVLALGGWVVAFFVLLFTKGSLGYCPEAAPSGSR
jgi:membrane protease YdiL (CAAX protease family)